MTHYTDKKHFLKKSKNHFNTPLFDNPFFAVLVKCVIFLEGFGCYSCNRGV